MQDPKTKKWHSMRMSEWAGGYTSKFCRRILAGAAHYLRKWHPEGDIKIPDDQRPQANATSGSAICTVYPMNKTDHQQADTDSIDQDLIHLPLGA